MSNLLQSQQSDLSHLVVVGLLEIMQEEMIATGSIETTTSVDTQIAAQLTDKKTQIQTMHSLMAMEVGMRARL